LSPELPAITAREVVRVAKKLGFAFRRQRGSHAIYRRQADGARLTIAMHTGRTLPPKTLAHLIADMGISVAEFRKLL
jgi:predicted RNA binding protein YcfA (HicA-like mRNA interferase family)